MPIALVQVGAVLVCAVVAFLIGGRTGRALVTGVHVGVFSLASVMIALAVTYPRLPVYTSNPPLKHVVIMAIGMLGMSAAVGLLLWGGRRLGLIVVRERRFRWTTWVVSLLGLITATLAGVLCCGALWLKSNFGYITADQMQFFLVNSGQFGGTPAQVESLTSHVIVPVACLAILGALIPFVFVDLRLAGTRMRLAARRVRQIAAGILVVFLAWSLWLMISVLPVRDFIRMHTVDSDFIQDHYVEPVDSILHFPQHPKNIVHIYLESVENSFYSKDEGGYLDQSLMPDLAELEREGVSFSNTDKFGGPLQPIGSNHTLAGILNITAGIPMIPRNNRTHSGLISYPDFRTLGDILYDHGYHTYFMRGSDMAAYYQLDDYLTEHGNFELFDLRTARERGLIPEDYYVWWGFEDDKLYEFSKTELTRIAAQDQPFYFVIENADTHNNDGYLSPNTTEFPSKFQYGNVIHYSQKEVTKLVRWIQQQPWYEDTVIILTGDHKSMDVTFFEGWDPDYDRTIVNIFLNGAPDPGPDRTSNRVFGPFDLFPTILASIGVRIDGDRLGLGTNLYSGQKTLFETYGFDQVNSDLGLKSHFYNQHLLRDKDRSEKSDAEQEKFLAGLPSETPTATPTP